MGLFLISFASCPTWTSRFLNGTSFRVIYSFSKASTLVFWASGSVGDCALGTIRGASSFASAFYEMCYHFICPCKVRMRSPTWVVGLRVEILMLLRLLVTYITNRLGVIQTIVHVKLVTND